MTLDPKLRTSKESTLFAIGVVFSALCWLALCVTIVGAVIGAMVGLFMLILHAVAFSHIRGNGVRLSERQLPDLYARCKAIAGQLGLEQMPEIYIVQAGGVLNAFATKIASRRYVVIYSNLADACQDPRQLEFIIGHEMGHLAAGHLRWNVFLLPFMLVPWLGPAYSRAREYSCDRCGFHVLNGELEPALRGLTVLGAGGKLAADVDLDTFMAQRMESGGFFMATLELCMSHPYLCKRIAALREYHKPGSVQEVSRTPLAYPLAPVLGMGAGGLASFSMIAVFYIGIMAAIAIPNFMKFQQKAKAAAEEQKILQQMDQDADAAD